MDNYNNPNAEKMSLRELLVVLSLIIGLAFGINYMNSALYERTMIENNMKIDNTLSFLEKLKSAKKIRAQNQPYKEKPKDLEDDFFYLSIGAGLVVMLLMMAATNP